MHWYLVQTKPRQERRAQENLERQGYACYLPLCTAEKIRGGRLALAQDPLFPRYLFAQIPAHLHNQSWVPMRSTLGVSRVVSFGADPVRVPDALIEHLRQREADMLAHPQALFVPGQRVRLVEPPFEGLEAVYQMADGESRVMVLIEILAKPVEVWVAPNGLRLVG